MCGIFTVLNDKNNQAGETVLEGLKKLEYRGYDSWGIAVIGKNKIEVEKHTGKINQEKTNLYKNSIAIGHTRWATHGGITEKNAHPHLDCNNEIAVIHNGIVENYLELKNYLINKKHRFISETDTEVIPHLIEENLKNNFIDKAVFKTFNQLVGSNAIIVLDKKTETIIGCRYGSPLVFGIDEKNQQYFLASDIPALLKHTRKVYFLDDLEMIVIRKNFFQLYDLKTFQKKSITFEIINWQQENAEKSGFPHFLIKEILEQSKTIEKTYLTNKDNLKNLKKIFLKKDIIFTGCGSAYHAGLFGKYFFADNGLKTDVIPANEFEYFSSLINKNTLLIAISQSGETADTILAVKKAKEKGGKILSILNNRGSTLERLSDWVIPINVGPEIAVVSTKAFISQVIIVYILSQIISFKNYKIDEIIKELIFKLKEIFDEENIKEIKKLAKKLYQEKHIYLIGKNIDYPAVLEIGLKIKETAYIHGEGFASGELKHGVIALIEKKTVCLVVASQEKIKNDILSAAIEVKSRGGKIIGISVFDSEVFEEKILIPKIKDLSSLIAVIVGQLLSYYLAFYKGLDPDKPRNLAKSVTVK